MAMEFHKRFASRLALLVFLAPVSGAFAEGSRNLNQGNVYRIFTAVQTQYDSPSPYRVYVYAKKGETILFGASFHDAPDNADIVVTDPMIREYQLNIVRSGKGFIGSPDMERVGPHPDKGGFDPLAFTAVVDGVYTVEFKPNQGTRFELKERQTADPLRIGCCFDDGISVYISAWDITVRSASGKDVPGRVFSYLLQGVISKHEASLRLYIVSRDGYIYFVELPDFLPGGFTFYSANRTLIDRYDDTFYHSISTADKSVFFRTGVKPLHASSLDTPNNVTHRLFFDLPAPDLPAFIPTVAAPPQPPAAFFFQGDSENKLAEGGTGVFKFVSPVEASFRIIIDTNGPENRPDGVFDTLDTFVESVCAKGDNRIFWNGQDRKGTPLTPLPGNASYKAQIVLKGAEIHFPLSDVENLSKGMKIRLLNPPYRPPGWNPDLIYYNDESYTVNGVEINLDGGYWRHGNTNYVTLPPSPRSALQGISSSSGAHAYDHYYGDGKIIDTWTFFPSPPAVADLVIVPRDQTGALQEQQREKNIERLKNGQSGDIILFHDILFLPDLPTIRNESYPTLDKVAVVLAIRTDLVIKISGYTNSIGNPSGELKLSIERAARVREYLIKRGIDGRRLIARGYGALNLKEERITAANRRVEFMIISSAQ